MRIDYWFDLNCPFCYLGRKYLQLALADFEHADQVEVFWYSYELNPSAPQVETRDEIDIVAEKYQTDRATVIEQQKEIAASAAAVGLPYNYEKVQAGNSFNAHRVLHYARSVMKDEALIDRFYAARFAEGAQLGDNDTLVSLSVEAGLDKDEVTQVLESDAYAVEVRDNERIASEAGFNSVPTFLFDEQYVLPGALPVETMLQALQEVWRMTKEEAPAAAE